MKDKKLKAGKGGVGGGKVPSVAVGSGSRPKGGKYPLPTSAPTDKQGLGRKPPGALK